MLGPYRDLVTVEADTLPDACVPRNACPQRCPHAPLSPPRGLPAAFAKALSASVTLLLLVGSASISAVTWTVTTTILRARAEPPAEMASPPQPRAAPSLASLGTRTHDADALWARAERFAG